MDKDVVMWTIGIVFSIVFFVVMPILLVYLSRHDTRATHATEPGSEDIAVGDLENPDPEVQAALREYSVHRISRAEFLEVAQKARS